MVAHRSRSSLRGVPKGRGSHFNGARPYEKILNYLNALLNHEDRSASPHRDAHNTRCSETGERKKNTTLYATLENCTTSAERERVCLVLSHVRSRSIPSMRGAVRAAAACSLRDVGDASRQPSSLYVTAAPHWLTNSASAIPLTFRLRGKFERSLLRYVYIPSPIASN